MRRERESFDCPKHGIVEDASACPWCEVERLREALKNEIRWNIEGTGIHPDDQEEVIERHYQEALHPDEKEDER